VARLLNEAILFLQALLDCDTADNVFYIVAYTMQLVKKNPKIVMISFVFLFFVCFWEILFRIWKVWDNYLLNESKTLKTVTILLYWLFCWRATRKKNLSVEPCACYRSHCEHFNHATCFMFYKNVA